MQTVIYGASDDLIEIEGDWEEEYDEYFLENKKRKIICSDGTEMVVGFDGEWKFEIKKQGSKFSKIIPSIPDGQHDWPHQDRSHYSDIIIFSEPLEWVRIGRRKLQP